MKKKINFQILIIIVLIIVLGTMCYYYFTSNSEEDYDYYSEETSQVQVQKSSEKTANNINSKVVSTTAEVTTGLTEKKELHATYYLEECYVEENQEIKAGENILKYTNGTYLTAPYDCVVKTIKIPETSSKCTNDHYIEISSTNNLAIQFKVDESVVNKLSIGQDAEIEITALSNKTITGNITKISNTAQKEKFTVTVEFQNDGEIKLGMTAKVVI